MNKPNLNFDEIMERITLGSIALIPIGCSLWIFSKFLIAIVNMWR